MKTPTIHLNGTSRGSLLEQNTDARHALDTAITALQLAAPNARDYYVQEEGAFEVARKEHNHRLYLLETVLDELEQIALAIEEGGK